MNTLKESWSMMKLSGRVVGKNPFLLVYILASGLAVTVLFGGALAPMAWNLGKGSDQLLAPYARLTEPQPPKKDFMSRVQPNWVPIAVSGAAVYFIGTFAMVFFNVAFLASVKKIVNGRPVSFREGIGLAWEKRAAVLKWSLFAATVGALFALLKSKLDNWLARRFLGAVEVGWNLGVFLAVPVVAAEGAGPFEALRRSAGIFGKTWGQTISGAVGIGVFQALAWFAGGFLPAAGMFYLGLADTGARYWLCFAGAGWLLLSAVLVAIASEAVYMVFRMVLYVFATEGAVPEEYKETDCVWFVAQRG